MAKKKLTFKQYVAELNSEFQRRLFMTLEDAGFSDDVLQRWHTDYKDNDETIKDQISGYAEKHDLADKDTDVWM